MLTFDSNGGQWWCPACGDIRTAEGQPPAQYHQPSQAYGQAQQPYQAPQQQPYQQPPQQYVQNTEQQYGPAPAQPEPQGYQAPQQQYGQQTAHLSGAQQYGQHAPPPQQQYGPPQQYARQPPKRQSWLVSKLPFIVGLVVGIVLGWVHPLLGVFGAFAASIAVGQFLDRDRRLAPNPKTAARFWSGIIYMIGGVLVVLTFTMPVSPGGLDIPPYYNPTTFMKYFSIVAITGNIGSTAPFTAFPGLPALVVGSSLVVFVGLVIPESLLSRRNKGILQVLGMALLTAAPAITHVALGLSGSIIFDYGIFFYVGWAGIGLEFFSEFVPMLMAKGQPAAAAAFVGFLPLAAFAAAAIASAVAQGHAGGAVFKDFESDHHNLAGIFSGLLGGLVGAGADAEIDNSKNILEMTYPAGRSPNVFTTGWLFGARCIVDAGTEKERDLSDSVQWSGSGGFNPSMGRSARPSFNGPGFNKIIITCDTGDKVLRKIYGVMAIPPDGFANATNMAFCPADAHGCPACPHPAAGHFSSFSPTVLVNGQPAVRVGDGGVHAACCGPNTFMVETGFARVRIDGRPAARIGDITQHCGGKGQIR